MFYRAVVCCYAVKPSPDTLLHTHRHFFTFFSPKSDRWRNSAPPLPAAPPPPPQSAPYAGRPGQFSRPSRAVRVQCASRSIKDGPAYSAPHHKDLSWAAAVTIYLRCVAIFRRFFRLFFSSARPSLSLALPPRDLGD